MSFSEMNYKHQVIVFDIDGENISNLESVEVPLSVKLLRVPSKNSKLSEVLSALDQLSSSVANRALAPYLEVRVLLDGPEPGLRHKIETALTGKYVRLAKIDLKYPASASTEKNVGLAAEDQLKELKPLEVFSKIYHSKFNTPVPETIQQLFNQVADEVAQTEPA